MRRVLPVLALTLWTLVSVARPAAAGPGRWTPFGPAGGDAKAIVVDPTDPSTIWIVSGRTVHKSTDGGVTWRSASRGLVGAVEFLAGDPGRPDTLYAAMSSAAPGIFRTDDGGAHWTRVVGARRDFTFVWSLAVAPSETPGGPGVVWVGTVLSVFRSRDGGVTWKEVLGNHQSAEIYVDIAPDPLHPGTVYAANLNHRYKTTDGGDHWQQLQEIPGEFQPHINAFAVAPSDPQTLYESGGPGALYRSHDGGISWEGPFPFEFDQLAVDPVDPDRVYGGNSRGLFLSRDGGESFLPAEGLPDLDLNTTSFYGVQALATVPGRAGWIFVGTRKGLFVSKDGGDSWSAPVRKGLYKNLVDLFLIDPFRPNHWVIQILGTATQTLDRGVTFTPFATTLPGRRVTLAFDPFVSGRIWATSGAETGYHLFRSDDGGAHWSRVPGTMPAAETLSFPAPRVLLAGGFGGIYRSENLGRTWRKVLDGVLDPRDENSLVAWFRRLVQDPRHPERIYGLATTSAPHVSGPPLIYRSVDFGRTWELWHTNGTLVAFDPFRPRATYVVEGHRVLVTLSDGGSFRLLATLMQPNGQSLTLLDLVPDRAHPGELWAATIGGVRRSLDGGKHWQDVSEGLAEGSRTVVPLLRQDPGRSTQWLAAPESGGLWRAEFAP